MCVYYFGIAITIIQMHLRFIKKALTEILPLISESFNIFLEIPLKIISRNYNYKVIPINWVGRKKGGQNLKLKN